MKYVAVAVAAVLAFLFATSAYTVQETDQVIITQFGEPVGEVIVDPGLHFKVPFIQKVNRLEKRWLEWDGEPDEMRTAEKTPILVDTYARWRIVDPWQFFLRLRSERRAQSRLDDIIGSETRNVLAAHPLIEVVRSTNRELPLPTDVRHTDGAKESGRGEGRDNEANLRFTSKVELGRHELTRQILSRVSKLAPDLGVEVVDLQFQRVRYTSRVEVKTFERMISERKRVAARYRSEGQGKSAEIAGRVTKDLKQIQSDAYRAVQELKGSADAEATAIYAAAHNLDPEFYKLVKSLESYEKTVDDSTTMILSTESDFFKTLTKMR